MSHLVLETRALHQIVLGANVPGLTFAWSKLGQCSETSSLRAYRYTGHFEADVRTGHVYRCFLWELLKGLLKQGLFFCCRYLKQIHACACWAWFFILWSLVGRTFLLALFSVAFEGNCWWLKRVVTTQASTEYYFGNTSKHQLYSRLPWDFLGFCGSRVGWLFALELDLQLLGWPGLCGLPGAWGEDEPWRGGRCDRNLRGWRREREGRGSKGVCEAFLSLHRKVIS